jgi:hypothetical protein
VVDCCHVGARQAEAAVAQVAARFGRSLSSPLAPPPAVPPSDRPV